MNNKDYGKAPMIGGDYTEEEARRILSFAEGIMDERKPAPMSDKEIVRPRSVGYGHVVDCGHATIRYTSHSSKYAKSVGVLDGSLYRLFETEAECKANARRETIRRKADLVRKRILREARCEGWLTNNFAPNPFYTAYLCGRVLVHYTGKPISSHQVPGWYYFPTPETCDRFFRIMGDELRELL